MNTRNNRIFGHISSIQGKKTVSKQSTARKPWLSDSDDSDLPQFETEDSNVAPTANQDFNTDLHSKRFVCLMIQNL